MNWPRHRLIEKCYFVLVQKYGLHVQTVKLGDYAEKIYGHQYHLEHALQSIWIQLYKLSWPLNNLGHGGLEVNGEGVKE